MTTLCHRRRWPAAAVLMFIALCLIPVRAEAGKLAAIAAQGGQDSAAAAHTSVTEKEEADENDQYEHSAVVKAIGARLGMSPVQAATAFEVTNFAILASLIGVLLAKTLPKTFRNRTGAIQKHLVDARMATEEATARMNSVEDRLSKLDGQIAAMREQAERDWAAEGQRVRASVEEEKQKILAAAEQEIAAATALARRQIQQFAADLAIDQAAKKLVVSAETDRLLVQSFARRLTGDGEKEGQN